MSQASTNPNPVAADPDLAAWLSKKTGATVPNPPASSREVEPDAPSEASEGWAPIDIDPSEIKTLWGEGWRPVEIVGAVMHTKKDDADKKSLKLTYKCFAGSDTGKYRDDYLPIAGKGLVKTYRVAESIGLRDAETGKVRISDPAMLIGRKMWVEIVHKTETWTNALGDEVETEKDEISFPNGYRAIAAFELPVAGDVFAEDGKPEAVKASSDAPPAF